MSTEKKQFSLGQRIVFSLITFLFLAFLIVAIGELGARLFYKTSPHFKKADIHRTLGWKSKANFVSEETRKDLGGTEYPILYQTTRDGFREFGDPNTSKTKVFFIGDSFTQAVEVDNKQTFYQHLKDSLDLEVFAYGQAGYGNLQQSMILDQYLDEIQPDFIVWQLCDNDFIDNHYELEKVAGYNVKLRRPYLRPNGEVDYLTPTSRGTQILNASRFLSLLADRIKWVRQQFSEEPPAKIAEELIATQQKDFAPFKTSTEVTRAVFQRAKERIGNTPTLVFSASS
ncbi:MAG: SGNH/GDSL hydrolase family protein, partial [Bacteroidota bacterium]